MNIHNDKILILDFGSQYTQLIARRVREIGVYCEIYPWDIGYARITDFAAKGIILSGGPETTMGDNAPLVSSDLMDSGVPILAICYAMQAIAQQFGGAVENVGHSEFGYAKVRAHGHTALLKGIQGSATEEGYGILDVWMSHGDRVAAMPKGFKLMCSTKGAPIAGMADEQRKIYCLQFHPEVTHTLQGKEILSRFCLDISACDAKWTPKNIIDDSIQTIQKQVGTDDVILGLSGGVDSAVVAAILHKAIGKQLSCIFVDNGLLRFQEGDEVMKTFAECMGVKVIRVDAEERFLGKLKGVSDPEAKRKVIGNLFIEIFEEQAAKQNNAKWLAQGTIYPDVIESAAASTAKAHLIKSHHNVGGLPDNMVLKLVEPLRELFKDEVRKIGETLGLAHAMVYRHPFPGPGLGVRILGEVKKEFADLLRLADHIFMDELWKHDLYKKTSQAFAVFLPVKSVGVTGDGRCYDYVIALRAVETIDFMTARWAHLPYDFLDRVARRIMNEVSGISRVTYDISGKPPATIEWE